MKYFLTEPERRKTQSSDYIEFQTGRDDGSHWKPDSLCLPSDTFFDLKL